MHAAVAALLDGFERRLAVHGDLAPAALRVGLGVVILLAGLHKLVAPGAWAVYLAPAFAAVWPVSVESSMVVFGLTELPVGLALLADRYAALAAAVVAVSMLGVLVDLTVAVAQTGRYADVLVRDLAVTALAVGVALQSAGDER